MKLTATQADLIEDLFNHAGYAVLEDTFEQTERDLTNKILHQSTTTEEIHYLRGQLAGLRSRRREVVEKMIRDAP